LFKAQNVYFFGAMHHIDRVGHDLLARSRGEARAGRGAGESWIENAWSLANGTFANVE
jgi:hypothetical protein